MERHHAISLAMQLPHDPNAAMIAMSILLRRKGRITDMLGNEARALREHVSANNRAALDALFAASRGLARNKLSSLMQQAPDAATTSAMSSLGNQRDQLARQIMGVGDDHDALLDALNARAEHVSVADVARAIPANAALVELTMYVSVDYWNGRVDGLHYAAFVLGHDLSVAFVDLGDRSELDALASRLRDALMRPDIDPRPLARSLDDRVMRPIRALLGRRHHVILAADGALSLVPFAALVDEQNRYLVENWSFTSLTTGRELARLAASRPIEGTGALVVADPDFGAPGAVGATNSQRGGSFNALKHATFPALAGTEEEGRAVAELLGASLMTRGAATRDSIAGVHGPRVLHIATHGFFLDKPDTSLPATRGLVIEDEAQPDSAPPKTAVADALFRSGLVFAGANHHRANADGIMTAGEALWLDLQGTELVVLSACETGLGDVSGGQGVRGLQQAFSLAGARALVMSLWKVDDAATRDLMIAFYGELARGQGRTEALRTAQLGVLASATHQHPYYWAAFMHYGDASPLPRGLVSTRVHGP